jgi:hypothetical protein
MQRPPDPKRLRASSGKPAPKCQNPVSSTSEYRDEVLSRQVKVLRRLFGISHSLACSVAALVYGGLPR